MKTFAAGTMLAALASPAAARDAASPIAKVIQMISDLQSKVISEGERAQKEYDEFSEWCEDQSKNLGNDIKTGKSEIEELKATIDEQTAKTAELSTKIEELAASLTTDEAELKAATDVRTKEAKSFKAEEAEMVDTIDTIGRATNILEKEMAKGGASMLQLKNAGNLVQALGALVQASALASADATRLTALVQSSQESDDDDDALGAPAAAAYKGKSGGIIDVLSDLMEKAEGQLDDARKKEQAASHNFQMVAQGLNDSIKFATKDTAAAKKGLGESAEKKAVAQGDLGVTTKALTEDTSVMRSLHQDCMGKSEDFESETKSRGEEMSALAKAKEIIVEATGGAAASFLQESVLVETESKPSRAVHFVRDLARKQNSNALAQLASRMNSAVRLGGGDIFGKVKTLINDMIEKLEAEAAQGASEKAFCDKELSESNAKKDELETEVAKLSTKLDQDSARSAKLKEQAAVLQKTLAALATSQAEMNKMRSEEKASFTQSEAETSKGLDGIKLALKVLREYYANADKGHSSSDGAAGGIVSLLEVCESDFSKSLAEMRTVEDSAASEYEMETKENKMEKLTKGKDVEYKNKESAGLDKAVAEVTSDRMGVQTELDAVLEYLEQLENKCVAKAESYSDKAAARAAEIAGLKEALTILSEQAGLLQVTQRTVKAHADWKPEPDSPFKLFEHPQGSGLVTPCPKESQHLPESCTAQFGDKADGQQCPQLNCPNALGKKFKLVCGGGCCPVCWAPDHVVAMDRHTSENTGLVVAAAPQAPSSCGGVKCFEPLCAEGFQKGHVSGSCCYSCTAGR